MKRFEIFEAVAGVWCVRSRRTASCSYIVKMSPGAVLVDSGTDPTGSAVMNGLQQARVGLSSLRAILVTHGHWSVNAGLAVLSKRSGAPVWAGSPSRGSHRSGWRARLPERGLLSALRPARGSEGVLTASTHLLEDGQEIKERFRAISSPGHTLSHFAFWHEGKRLLFTGDSLSVLEGRIALPAKSSTEDEALARASIASLLEHEPRVLLPGHGLPLSDNLRRERDRARSFLDRGAPWPRFGGALD